MESAVPPADQVEKGEEVKAVASPSNSVMLPKPKSLLFAKARLKGAVYDIDHLNSFSFSMKNGENAFTVGVIFSCHCFTKKWEDKYTNDMRYTHNSETRAFCIDRYNMSKLLPEMIMGLGNQSVYWNSGGNFFFWRNHPLASPYLVFFNARKARDKGIDVLMNIDSAHLKPNMKQQAAPVKFTTLVEAKATGKELKPGRIQHIKRK